eukprot:CAMPEP_0119028954 /NCGR_PEP_ID=MMETSP1176-20130426/39874_1 /TAXON_ID=265551 /ORGANISM="Synedropsis recta cf, Strain CCMP1620" /LENGTH=386 /DNA_ID=CAMNT_0006985213 /DNA_START=52 /DNA_END=1209 /DNA_ORIENTATION=-
MMSTNLRRCLLLALFLLPHVVVSQDVTLNGWWSSCSTNDPTNDFCAGATLTPLSTPTLINYDACYVNPSLPSVSVSFFKQIGGEMMQYHVLFTAPQFAVMPVSCTGDGECECGPELEKLKIDVGADCNDSVTFTYQCASLPMWTTEQFCYVPANFTYLESIATGNVNECVMVAQVGVAAGPTAAAPVPTTPPTDALITLTPSAAVIVDSPTAVIPTEPPTTRAPNAPSPRPSPNPTPRPTVIEDINADANGISAGETAAAVIFGLIMVVVFILIGKPCPCQRNEEEQLEVLQAKEAKQFAIDDELKSVHSVHSYRNKLNILDDDGHQDPEQAGGVSASASGSGFGESAFAKSSEVGGNNNNSFTESTPGYVRQKTGAANIEAFGAW